MSYFCVFVFCCFQLPGFYFDPDKKRYFRIVSDHGNVISGAITAKVVASKNEHKRPPLSPALGAVKRH